MPMEEIYNLYVGHSKLDEIKLSSDEYDIVIQLSDDYEEIAPILLKWISHDPEHSLPPERPTARIMWSGNIEAANTFITNQPEESEIPFDALILLTFITGIPLVVPSFRDQIQNKGIGGQFCDYEHSLSVLELMWSKRNLLVESGISKCLYPYNKALEHVQFEIAAYYYCAAIDIALNTRLGKLPLKLPKREKKLLVSTVETVIRDYPPLKDNEILQDSLVERIIGIINHGPSSNLDKLFALLTNSHVLEIDDLKTDPIKFNLQLINRIRNSVVHSCSYPSVKAIEEEKMKRICHEVLINYFPLIIQLTVSQLLGITNCLSIPRHASTEILLSFLKGEYVHN